MVFDTAGRLIDHWGEGIFGVAHGVCMRPDDSTYFIDQGGHFVMKFSKDGRHQLTLGNRDTPSDTGYSPEIREPDDSDPAIPGGEPGSRTEALSMINGVARAGGPFNQPTDLAVDAEGVSTYPTATATVACTSSDEMAWP
jgi:hypothetical protein